MRSRRISKPHDFKRHFLEIAHMLIDNDSRRYLKLYYYTKEELIKNLASGTYYQESYFTDNINSNKLEEDVFDIPITEWNELD